MYNTVNINVIVLCNMYSTCVGMLAHTYCTDILYTHICILYTYIHKYSYIHSVREFI